MSYSIEFTDLAVDELEAIKKFHRQRIIDAVERQLVHSPTTETKNRKILAGIELDFEHRIPVWELRVGQFRVLYDVSQELKLVTVRAVREKPPHKTTEQII